MAIVAVVVFDQLQQPVAFGSVVSRHGVVVCLDRCVSANQVAFFALEPVERLKVL